MRSAMATSGDLILKVAELFGLPENAVAYPYRVLRDNGLVSKGGRGRSAAKVNPQDTSMLLTAVASTFVSTRDMLSTARELAQLPITRAGYSFYAPHFEQWDDNSHGDTSNWQFKHLHLPSLQALSEGHSLGEAVAAIIGAAVTQELDKAHEGSRAWDAAKNIRKGIIIEYFGPKLRASIDVSFINSDPLINSGAGAGYGPEEMYRTDPAKSWENAFDLRCKISSRAIFELAELLKT
jgi:predicted transcriptional regulator